MATLFRVAKVLEEILMKMDNKNPEGRSRFLDLKTTYWKHDAPVYTTSIFNASSIRVIFLRRKV